MNASNGNEDQDNKSMVTGEAVEQDVLLLSSWSSEVTMVDDTNNDNKPFLEAKGVVESSSSEQTTITLNASHGRTISRESFCFLSFATLDFTLSLTHTLIPTLNCNYHCNLPVSSVAASPDDITPTTAAPPAAKTAPEQQGESTTTHDNNNNNNNSSLLLEVPLETKETHLPAPVAHPHPRSRQPLSTEPEQGQEELHHLTRPLPPLSPAAAAPRANLINNKGRYQQHEEQAQQEQEQGQGQGQRRLLSPADIPVPLPRTKITLLVPSAIIVAPQTSSSFLSTLPVVVTTPPLPTLPVGVVARYRSFSSELYFPTSSPGQSRASLWLTLSRSSFV
ncbi:hypothetical protein BKA57DRAFT_506343 [Linnemannia elongata]|nr:hypothetical protein BKA57DRAFT_506343 [Linnemannia elongata]